MRDIKNVTIKKYILVFGSDIHNIQSNIEILIAVESMFCLSFLVRNCV